jgi:hypothetical protein
MTPAPWGRSQPQSRAELRERKPAAIFRLILRGVLTLGDDRGGRSQPQSRDIMSAIVSRRTSCRARPSLTAISGGRQTML